MRYDYVPLILPLLIASLSRTVFLFAQVPDTQWVKTYGGVGEDRCFDVHHTSDGGYILTGYLHPGGSYFHDVYAVKIDSLGNMQWGITIGGDEADEGYAADQTDDGGYIITGFTESYGYGYRNVYLIRLNADGDTLWTRTYTPQGSDDRGWDVRQTAESGYIIAVSTDIQMMLIKTDSLGSVEWTKSYGSFYSGGYSVDQTFDGGYIIGGFGYPYGNYDYYIVKTDSLGDTLWTKIYGVNEYDRCYEIKQTSDSGYIAAGGWNELYDRWGSDFSLVRMDQNGTIIWHRLYGGSSDDVANSVDETCDGGFIMTGRTYSFGAGNWDIYVVRTDSSGDTLWTKTYGSAEIEMGYSVETVGEEEYIIGGWTSYYGAGDSDFYILKLGLDTLNLEEQRASHYVGMDCQIFPNPFTNTTSVKLDNWVSQHMETLRIVDLTGRAVCKLEFPYIISGEPLLIQWDGRDSDGFEVPNGIYYLLGQCEDRILLKSIIKIQ
jgi:hypothetical protein